jgi:osmotically-inducible protein OsmY
MESNETLQKEVQESIKWEPLLNTVKIGVAAKDGIVTLTGVVDNFEKKLQAEQAAKNVRGVTAVVENIIIKVNNSLNKSDYEIANEVSKIFKSNLEFPIDKIKVKVEEGWITLEGQSNWNYQKIVAENSIKNILGLKGISNNITIKPESHDAIEKTNIERAFERNWTIHNLNIKVSVVGTTVILTGTVNSLQQKEEAGRIAWNAPGVWKVDNELLIDYKYSF